MKISGYNDLEDSKITINGSVIEITLCRIPKQLTLNGSYLDQFIEAFKNSNLPIANYKLKIICKYNDVWGLNHWWTDGILKDNECFYCLNKKNTKIEYIPSDKNFTVKNKEA